MFGLTRLSLVALALSATALAGPHSRQKRRSAHHHDRHVEERSGGNSTHTLAKRAFTGRGTYYYVGLGACGTYSNDNDYMVALNGAQYGGGYPGPQCFKSITVQANGVTVSGIQVLDECPSSYCNFGDLDLSPGLFSRFADHSAGTLQITWWFEGDSPAPAPEPSPEPTTSKWVAPSPAWTPPSTTEAPPPPPTSTWTPPPSSTSVWVAPTSTSTWVAPSPSTSSSTSTPSTWSSISLAPSSSSSAAVNSTNPFAIVATDNSTSTSTSLSASASTSTGTGDVASTEVIQGTTQGNLVAINGLVAAYGQLIVVGAGGYE